MFFCVKGEVRIRLLIPCENRNEYYDFKSEPSSPSAVVVHPGTAAALYNDTDEEALVINMPSPAWSKEAPDEWPVEGWEDK